MKLLLRHELEPGDVLMMTAAVRELHRSHPGRYTVAVETRWPEIWENNPHVVSRDALGAPDREFELAYPLVNFANQRPYHFIHGMVQHLAWRLEVPINVAEFKGDLHLSEAEKNAPNPIGKPFWIIVAGGKYDFTAKWWNPRSYQAVVDHFRGRIQFVQCGAAGHWHLPLEGVTNLVGKTSLRQLINLMYHADGVLCPVTFAMHLSVAVPLRPGRLSRGCVVVAGGREPVQWEMYPGHQFLHTQGALDPPLQPCGGDPRQKRIDLPAVPGRRPLAGTLELPPGDARPAAATGKQIRRVRRRHSCLQKHKPPRQYPPSRVAAFGRIQAERCRSR